MAYSFTSSGATPFKSNVSSGIGQMMKPQTSFSPTTPKVNTSQMLGNVYNKIKSAVSNYQVPKIPQTQVAPTVQPFSGYTSNLGTNTKQSLSSGIGQMMNKPTASSTPAPKVTQPAKVQPGMISQDQLMKSLAGKTIAPKVTQPTTTTTKTTPTTPTTPANITPPAQPQIQYQPQAQQYQPQSNVDTSYTPPVYSAENTSLNAQAIADMANRSRQPSEDFSKQREYANQIAAEQESLAKDFAEKNKNIQGTAGFLTQQTGLQGQLQSQFNQGQQALASKYAAAAGLLPSLTSQQQTQQSALGSAISSSMPGMQFGQMTSQQTGRPISGGTYMDNPMLNVGVREAVRIAMQSGPSSPEAQAIISKLDYPGQVAYAQALQQATGGTYNPGMMDTMARNNEAIAKAFADTGTTINAAKQNISGLGKQATDLIQQAGLNTRDANWANEKINTYVTAQSNPVAYRSLLALNNEAQKFFSTIAGADPSGKLIPTLVSANIQNLDITDLSALKLNEFLENIKAIGTAQAETAISQSGGAAGTGATGFYTGGNQGYNTNLNPGSTNYSSALSQGLVAGGVGLGSLGVGGAVGKATGAGTFLEKVLGGIFR